MNCVHYVRNLAHQILTAVRAHKAVDVCWAGERPPNSPLSGALLSPTTFQVQKRQALALVRSRILSYCGRTTARLRTACRNNPPPPFTFIRCPNYPARHPGKRSGGENSEPISYPSNSLWLFFAVFDRATTLLADHWTVSHQKKLSKLQLQVASTVKKICLIPGKI